MNTEGLPDIEEQCRNYQRMAKVLGWLSDNFKAQPSLDEAAQVAGMSQAHFQRVFTRWAGVSPKRFVQCLTLEHAKKSLLASQSVLDTALAAGLSGPSRLHDLFVQLEAMSPGEFKAHGRGLHIRYGFGASPFGECIISSTSRGICGLAFVDETGHADAVEQLRAPYYNAQFTRDDNEARALLRTVFSRRRGDDSPLKLLVSGTAFQVKVWQALLAIQAGEVVSYGQVAQLAGRPRAVRAAASAVAANPVGYLIPCHRVIQKSGVLGGYRWGSSRKLAILSRESLSAAQAEPASHYMA